MTIHTASPYGEERNPREEIRVSPRACWVMIAVFLLMIAVPPIYRETSGDGLGPALVRVFSSREGRLADRLRGFEMSVDEGSWIERTRRGAQWMWTATFREGNRKVFIGRDGQFILRPGLRALTGHGPLRTEPRSVAKDPTLADWQQPLPVISDFASDLRERGIEFVLVPVPDKAAIRSAGTDGLPCEHPDAGEFYRRLENAGVRVIRLGNWLSLPGIDRSTRGFLRQDTHWNPAGMQAAAREIARRLGHEPARTPAGNATEPAPPPIEQRAFGDLVRRLELPDPAHLFDPESVILEPSRRPDWSDDQSPFVLLGDSFVNIFEDPDLGWAAPGAGFAAHLAAASEHPWHVLAINGGGASECRERFARLPDDVVRSKKLVLWVLAERDLFLTATPARENEVAWRRVKFNPDKSTEFAPGAGAVVVEATVRAKSALQDVKTLDYDDALYTARFGVTRVVSGGLSTAEVDVVLWNFKKRRTQPTARLDIGKSYRLTLVRFAAKEDLSKINMSDDFLSFDLWFAESTEPVP